MGAGASSKLLWSLFPTWGNKETAGQGRARLEARGSILEPGLPLLAVGPCLTLVAGSVFSPLEQAGSQDKMISKACLTLSLYGAHLPRKSILLVQPVSLSFLFWKLSCSMDEWGDVSRVPKLGFSNAEYGRGKLFFKSVFRARDKEAKKNCTSCLEVRTNVFPPGSQSDSSGICCFLEIRFLYCNRSMYTCERKIVLLEGKG